MTDLDSPELLTGKLMKREREYRKSNDYLWEEENVEHEVLGVEVLEEVRIREKREERSSLKRFQKYIEKGGELFLAQVTEQEPKEKRLEDVPVIQDFPEVFPDDLPGLPPPRQVKFRIDLILGAAPVTRAPYRLAPSELKELSEQLRELTEKDFIRPKKKDGSNNYILELPPPIWRTTGYWSRCLETDDNSMHCI
ncbi:hypothetical protein Tco_1483978 [Tanacetum coccineum]